MPQMSASFALPLLLSAAGLFYMILMGHLDPLRLVSAALTGSAAGLAVLPVLERTKGGKA